MSVEYTLLGLTCRCDGDQFPEVPCLLNHTCNGLSSEMVCYSAVVRDSDTDELNVAKG